MTKVDLKPLPGFHHVETHHCVTGSMLHMYLFHGHDLSEDLLLGLGGGVGFNYWHFKGQMPFFGGRRVDRNRSLEVTAGERTGVVVEEHTTSSASKAEKPLLESLGAGQPVMLQVDMGFLPYFDFGGEAYHFGGHVVVACGYDPATRQVLIADRDADLHPVPMDALAQARGSKHKPFPPQHKWYTFDFSQKRLPSAAEVRAAIAEQVRTMLEPPISNVGVKGIRRAGQEVPTWPQKLDERTLRMALLNAYFFISPVGGTGGGTFRYMFSRFLREAVALLGDDRLHDSADEFRRIGDAWEARALWFKEASEASDPASWLDAELTAWFEGQAGCEQVAWERLRALVG